MKKKMDMAKLRAMKKGVKKPMKKEEKNEEPMKIDKYTKAGPPDLEKAMKEVKKMHGVKKKAVKKAPKKKGY